MIYFTNAFSSLLNKDDHYVTFSYLYLTFYAFNSYHLPEFKFFMTVSYLSFIIVFTFIFMSLFLKISSLLFFYPSNCFFSGFLSKLLVKPFCGNFNYFMIVSHSFRFSL